MFRFTAYWIAFGPHGPRALPPPDQGRKVALGTAIGVLVSAVLFFGIRAFAGPPPKTMTKEWQEASNEYLKVQSKRSCILKALFMKILLTTCLLVNRARSQIPSRVSRPRATRARAWFSHRRRGSRHYSTDLSFVNRINFRVMEIGPCTR